MKTKLFILSTLTTCIPFICNAALSYSGSDGQSQQQQYQQYNTQQYNTQGGAYGTSRLPPPNSSGPQNVGPNGQRPCYPASQCIGNPYTSSYSYQSQTNVDTSSKPLSIESSEQISGSVKAINRVQMPDQTQIQMILTTPQGDLLVIVGPSTYMDQQKIKFQAGDEVIVTGYRITANGQEVIVAASIQKNGNTLQLLDERRQPVWGSQSYSSQYYGPMAPGYSQGYSYQNQYTYPSNQLYSSRSYSSPLPSNQQYSQYSSRSYSTPVPGTQQYSSRSYSSPSQSYTSPNTQSYGQTNPSSSQSYSSQSYTQKSN